MHGSPVSRWDNRSLWEHYDYHEFGIIGEPYFDVNFNKVLYLTDTGRRWDGIDFNVRDKVKSRFKCNLQTTNDIMDALSHNGLPHQVMLNIHPQRWHDRFTPWVKELIWQNTKNIGKRFLVRTKQ
jgi:hypothetical protein